MFEMKKSYGTTSASAHVQNEQQWQQQSISAAWPIETALQTQRSEFESGCSVTRLLGSVKPMGQKSHFTSVAFE